MSGVTAERSPRSPAVVYSVGTAALVVLLATLALTARQPAPPAIAEFAPQAQHQIRKAPLQQTSNFGNSAGSATQPGGTTTTTAPPAARQAPPPTAPPAIDLPAVHHCVGNPPRQIADTQSPPCIAYWSGNNGGATSRGVTANTVSVLVDPPSIGDQNSTRVINDLQTFFNRNFEFYDRQLVLNAGSNETGNCPTLESDADGLVQQYKPFASIGNDAYRTCAQLEFAHDHVVALGFQNVFSEATMASYAPYLWEYPMAPDPQFAAAGRFVCDQLAGHTARFSPAMSSKTRKFGLINEYDATPYPVPTTALADALAACGVKLAATETYVDQNTGNSQEQQSVVSFSNNAVLAMNSAGVTTVLCFCLNVDTIEAAIPIAADNQNYFPEWFLTSSENSVDIVVKTLWPPPDQRQSLMGMTFMPAQVPYADSTLNIAISSVDPGFEVNDASVAFAGYQALYWQLLQLASGIQMAGPNLTPATFERALHTTTFPNPFSPQQEGAVGFAPASHAMTTDAAVMWWSNAAGSPYPDDQGGAWCYVNGGTRFGDWTRPMSLFQGACDSSPPGS